MKVGDIIVEYANSDGTVEDYGIVVRKRDFCEYNEQRFECFWFISNEWFDWGEPLDFEAKQYKFDDGKPWFELVEV